MSSKTPPAASSSKKTASRGLGRGLSSLLGDSGIAAAAGAGATASSKLTTRDTGPENSSSNNSKGVFLAACRAKVFLITRKSIALLRM